MDAPHWTGDDDRDLGPDPMEEACDCCNAGPLEDCAEDCTCDHCFMYRGHPQPCDCQLCLGVSRQQAKKGTAA